MKYFKGFKISNLNWIKKWEKEKEISKVLTSLMEGEFEEEDNWIDLFIDGGEVAQNVEMLPET